MSTITTKKQAKEIAGNVSLANSKMPGTSYAISATKCKIGGKLVNIPGSVCHRCYALKLEKLRPSVNKGWLGNYEKFTTMVDNDPKTWVKACTFLIRKGAEKTGEPFHRWFDSGDLQSVAMLDAIVQVALATPEIKHWLPTRETKIVKDWLAKNERFPENLCVRVSSPMINDNPISGYPNTSTVINKEGTAKVWACPALNQNNSCGDCRACWDTNVSNVTYKLH